MSANTDVFDEKFRGIMGEFPQLAQRLFKTGKILRSVLGEILAEDNSTLTNAQRAALEKMCECFAGIETSHYALLEYHNDMTSDELHELLEAFNRSLQEDDNPFVQYLTQCAVMTVNQPLHLDLFVNDWYLFKAEGDPRKWSKHELSALKGRNTLIQDVKKDELYYFYNGVVTKVDRQMMATDQADFLIEKFARQKMNNQEAADDQTNLWIYQLRGEAGPQGKTALRQRIEDEFQEAARAGNHPELMSLSFQSLFTMPVQRVMHHALQIKALDERLSIRGVSGEIREIIGSLRRKTTRLANTVDGFMDTYFFTEDNQQSERLQELQSAITMALSNKLQLAAQQSLVQAALPIVSVASSSDVHSAQDDNASADEPLNVANLRKAVKRAPELPPRDLTSFGAAQSQPVIHADSDEDSDNWENGAASTYLSEWVPSSIQRYPDEDGDGDDMSAFQINDTPLKTALLKKIDDYLEWRENNSVSQNRGYENGLFTFFRHMTAFGRERAVNLKDLLSGAFSDETALDILVRHFKDGSSRVNNHSLDTYLLEGYCSVDSHLTSERERIGKFGLLASGEAARRMYRSTIESRATPKPKPEKEEAGAFQMWFHSMFD